MSRRASPANQEYLEEMDSHLQGFIYSFMPALFSDISMNHDKGFTETQTQQVNQYFDQAITLCAIIYPYRTFLFFGGLTHIRIRKLRKFFNAWCKACSDSATPPSAKEKIRHKMQDALRRLSKNYQGVRQVSLNEEQRRLVLAVTGSVNDTIKGIPQLGLKSLDHFLEWSFGAPGAVSATRRSRRTPSANKLIPPQKPKKD